MEKRIAKDLLSIGAVFLRPDEPFTWASGIKSPIYCDNRLTLTAPAVRGDVENGLAETIKREYPQCEVLMGTSTAGIAHAAITAHLMNLPMGYVRSGAKDHGRANQIEGKLEKGQKVVVVEDLISTGGSVIEVVNVLRAAGAEVLGIASIFTYGMKKGLARLAEVNVKNVSLSNFDVLVEVAAEEGYIAKEDIHVYSVDECFMDVTRYLSLYHLTAKEMAQKLIDAVMEETGITATAGIGTNLYLAKIAMDIVAKHIEDHIGMLDEISYREQLWGHKPLSDFWRIGSKTERKLAGYGIQTMGDIALASIQSEDWLYKMFGIDAELLIDHAWGCESCKMSDIKNYHTEEHSLSNGQVLMRNYTFEEAAVVVREMTDVLVLDLVEKGLVTNSVTLWIAYDHRFERESSKGTVRFPDRTNRSREIIDTVEALYRKIADPHTGIRRIEIIANKITPEGYQQYTLFQDSIKAEKERHLQEAVLQVKKRYGKNAIMRGSNLLECSTYQERNNQVGGHRA